MELPFLDKNVNEANKFDYHIVYIFAIMNWTYIKEVWVV